MDIDNDIEQLLKDICKGQHPVDLTIRKFLESLPGYENSLHSPLTVKKYSACLLTGPNCFAGFLRANRIENIEECRADMLELYKSHVLNKVDLVTARSHITAARQLLTFTGKLEWTKAELAKNFHLPKKIGPHMIRTVPREVIKMLLEMDWGRNPFVVARNRLTCFLFASRGLRPLEMPRLKMGCIVPYKDLAYLWPVIGKKLAQRFVMLDQETLQVLKVYLIERAHFALRHHIKDDALLLAEVARNGSYVISKAGIQAVIARIKTEMLCQGCLWDLSALNPQGLRRSAESAEYERAEFLPINNPQLSIPGQYGHSQQVSEKHYWAKSKRNAYLLAKGGPLVDKLRSEGDEDQIKKEMQDNFPETKFYHDLGLDI
jgi:site-specific recombinase XerD